MGGSGRWERVVGVSELQMGECGRWESDRWEIVRDGRE